MVGHEILIGSLTYHPTIEKRYSKRFDGKVSSDGKLINNKLLGIRRVDYDARNYKHLGVFAGANSVGADVAGVIAGYGAWYDGGNYLRYRAGGVVGAYHQNCGEFTRRKLKSPCPIAPIGGAEISFTLRVAKISFSVNNIISPIITNHTIGIEF